MNGRPIEVGIRSRRLHGRCIAWFAGLVGITTMLLAGARPAYAHELEETAVTLVVRDGGALELRVACTWSRLLAPSSSRGPTSRDLTRERLAQLAAEPAAAFAVRVGRLQRALEAGLVARLPGGATRAFTAWQWPAAADIHESVRRELMATMTGGTEHHASRLVAVGRLVLGTAAPRVQVMFPAQLGAVLFTTLRPVEQWLAPSQPSPMVSLQR